jgi:hypothetical protein
MSFETFLSDTIATVLGGGLLAFVFFVLQDRCFAPPDISGVWTVRNATKATAYRPFENMKLTYTIVMWQSGTAVHGTAEKTGESTAQGDKDYEGVARTRGVLSGSILKRYLSSDVITIHVSETGALRESTAFFRLKYQSRHKMSGTWQSTAADSSGETIWERKS